MRERVLSTLEYDKIIGMLCEHTASSIGRELAGALLPFSNTESVQRQLDLTEEAQSHLISTGRSPIGTFSDMRACLKRIHAALYISAGELLGISTCLRAARFAREALCDEEREGLLENLAIQLIPHRNFEQEIARCILSEDEIADEASSALSRIRFAMRQSNERVRERLNQMIHSTSYQKYLQEPLITIRNGRYVIPVKQEYRQYVQGLIHDQSSSGATLFIEPTAIVELGNEYKRLLSEEAAEIQRILSELTAMIAPHAQDILSNISILAQLDVLFAKASLAREMRAVKPKLNAEGYIHIVQGRHPLIPQDVVVPVDIWLGKTFKTLIITGPNTGGKTVTLKTLGLFSLMAQSGLFVPAGQGSELSVFHEVYADIGDEQSIEQSLSTFSSHMTNIVSILEKADEHSLVLLDELGAGTDPTEGAALAMSILDELHARGCICAATTHYSEIKAFVMTREGMQNASMAFDVDRLCPTYRLFIGIAGKSNAFEISKRLGLSEHLIQNARNFLTAQDVQFEDVLSSAQAQRSLAEAERKEAQEARLELERLKQELERERVQMEAERDRVKTKAREEARKLVADTRAEMEALVVQVRALKHIDQSSADRTIQKSRDALREREGKLVEPARKKTSGNHSTPPKAVQPGDTVHIVSLDKEATVLNAPDAKGEVLVQAGIIKLTVALNDLRTVKPKETGAGRGSVQVANKPMSLELDVRGMMVDEAIITVDRYLDNAAMQGFSEVSIIHGKGTGALRAGLHEHFRRHAGVESFRMGNYGEGDAGVTVVSIRK